MAKKKQLNEEALALTEALKVALSFNKDADVVTHGGRLIAHTSVGIVFVPCSFELSFAVKAKNLYDALKGADAMFSIAELGNEVHISWGKRRAALPTRSKVSVSVRAPDAVAAIDVPENLSELLQDAVKDLTEAGVSAYSNFLFFTNGAAFWSNGNVAAMISTQLGMPDVLVYVKDVKAAMSHKSRVVNIGGSAASITFYFEDGLLIQIPTVDDSTAKYPKDGLLRLFQPNLYETSYPLTEEHLDAIDYVSQFAENVLYVQPTFIGTSADPRQGTSVETEGLPLDLCIRADVMKVGGFKKATSLIKAAQHNTIAFFTYRPNVTFCFVKIKDRGHEA